MVNPFDQWPATVEQPNGFVREPLPITEYLSFSRIKVLSRSPRHYWWRYVLGRKDKDTPAKREGVLIHKALVETEDFLRRMRVIPDPSEYWDPTKADLVSFAEERGYPIKKSATKGDITRELVRHDPSLRTRLYEVAAAEFERTCPIDALRLTKEQADRFTEIIRSVQGHEKAFQLMDGGYPEVTAYWWDKEFNVLWRCQIDYLKIVNGPSGPRVWIMEAKSTQSAHPDDFPRDIYSMGYYLQTWIYKRVIHGITRLPVNMVHVVVERNEPYNCETYEIDKMTQETAYWQVGRLIEQWRTGIQTGVWPGYSDGKINPIGLPAWGTYRIEQQADKEMEQS